MSEIPKYNGGSIDLDLDYDPGFRDVFARCLNAFPDIEKGIVAADDDSLADAEFTSLAEGLSAIENCDECGFMNLILNNDVKLFIYLFDPDYEVSNWQMSLTVIQPEDRVDDENAKANAPYLDGFREIAATLSEPVAA